MADLKAGWALVQSDCHKWMNLLIATNNDFANANPANRFRSFPTAVDQIVRDEFSKRKNDGTRVSALSPFIFDVFRRVWLSTKPFQLPSSFPHDNPGPVRVMMAPFLVIKDFENQARNSHDLVVGLDVLYDYVEENLESMYKLEKLLRPGPTTAAGPELSNDEKLFLSQHAQFREATQSTRVASSQSLSRTPEVAPIPITAGYRAVQELRNHLADGFRLDFDDICDGEILKKLLMMNPDAVKLIKTFLDRLVDAYPEWTGEMGCLACIVTNNEEKMGLAIQGDELETHLWYACRPGDELETHFLYACNHFTEECMYSFSLRRV